MCDIRDLCRSRRARVLAPAVSRWWRPTSLPTAIWHRAAICRAFNPVVVKSPRDRRSFSYHPRLSSTCRGSIAPATIPVCSAARIRPVVARGSAGRQASRADKSFRSYREVCCCSRRCQFGASDPVQSKLRNSTADARRCTPMNYSASGSRQTSNDSLCLRLIVTPGASACIGG